MFVRFCTQSVFEAPRHHGVVSAEDAQGVVFRMFQQQAQTEAVVTLVVGGDRQLRGRGKKKKKASQTSIPLLSRIINLQRVNAAQRRLHTWLKMFQS